MRPYCSVWQLTWVFLGCVLFAALAITAKFFFDNFISNRMLLNLPLNPNDTSRMTSFNIWKDIPFPIRETFYFFHVENPAEVVEFGEKPILTEVGPFTYRQRRHKKDVQFSANRSTVLYRELRYFDFDAKESLYLANKTVRVLNVPLLTVLYRAQSYPFFARMLLAQLIFQTKSSLFVERTVHELLWGYEDPLLVKLKDILPDEIPFTKVGWFIKQNATDQGLFEVYTGSDGNLSRYLDVVSFKSLRRLDLWPPGKDSYCNSFQEASDGSAFGPFVKSTQRLRTFFPRMCRGAFESVFDGQETRRDVLMFRFRMDNQTFGNASSNPSNACFCSTSVNESSTSCPPVGTLNITACSFGAPVYLSQPHFLNADSSLRRGFKGLMPIPEVHDSFFYIEPTSGINTGAKGRLQLNGHIRNSDAFPQIFKNVEDNLIFPVLWVEEAATLNERTFHSVIKSRIVDKIRLVKATEALLVALTVFTFLTMALLMGQRWNFKRSWYFSRERLVPVDFEDHS